MNDIENNLNTKKAKHITVYTQIEVDNLLKSQEIYLFSEFQKYIEGMRSCVNVNIPIWTF